MGLASVVLRRAVAASATATARWRTTTTTATTAAVTRASSTDAAATSTKKRRHLKSLALSVYFKQPDFGMKEYEILSRASAFLLGVDAPDDDDSVRDSTAKDGGDSPYSHLEVSERIRQQREYKQLHGNYTPASGRGRDMMDLGWLEFVPREVRPKVHVVCSSHVVSPFLWKDYYPQDWLSHVKQEHCKYTLEVFDHARNAEDGNNATTPKESLAKLALNPHPFHHPEGRDIALVHFENEDSSLKLLHKLGVDILYLRHPDKLYQKHESMVFDGFVVSEPNKADHQEYGHSSKDEKKQEENREQVVDEDLRIFYPYRQTGQLSFHTNDRFFATTTEPLPEGMCGCPVLDTDGDLCGTVEGIVPTNHKNKQLAGNAAFMPSYVMQAFVDYVERGLVERMMPKDLFQMVVTAKKTNTIGGGEYHATNNDESKSAAASAASSDIDEAYDFVLETMKKRYNKQEMEEILTTIERERKQVLEILEQEGGDIDEIIQRVRHQTQRQIQEFVLQDQYKNHSSKNNTNNSNNTDDKDGGGDDDSSSSRKEERRT